MEKKITADEDNRAEKQKTYRSWKDPSRIECGKWNRHEVWIGFPAALSPARSVWFPKWSISGDYKSRRRSQKLRELEGRDGVSSLGAGDLSTSTKLPREGKCKMWREASHDLPLQIIIKIFNYFLVAGFTG